MNFNEFENRMSQLGYTTLAEIARALDTTPQAVSNWKSRMSFPSKKTQTIFSKFKLKYSFKVAYSINGPFEL